MTPIDQLRLEKAASDCGFEMVATLVDGRLMLRSARFPETVSIEALGDKEFILRASNLRILEVKPDALGLRVMGFGELYAALRKAAAAARTMPNRVAEIFQKQTQTMPKTTEAERLVVQRVGQNLFRAALLDYWGGKCSVSGLDMPSLLRASHARPWARCDTDEQRLDVFNGLLLNPQLDALFDSGLMMVLGDGRVELSSALTAHQRAQLGIASSMHVEGLTADHLPYLDFHRAHVWKG